MKCDTLSIKRELPGGVIIKIALTQDELYRAYELYEHHLDVNYVEGRVNSDEDDRFEHLTDEQWENAVNEIAWEKRRQQDKYEYDEDAALDKALCWFKNTRLPEIVKRRYFAIRLGVADGNSVVSKYVWSYGPVTRENATKYIQDLGLTFDEIIEISAIPDYEVDVWFDNPAAIPELN